MAIRSSGFHPIKVAVDMNGVARNRKLDERTDVQDVVRDWLDAYPSHSTYAAGTVAVGEIELLGSSFVMEYCFRDESLAAAFGAAFDRYVISPTLWDSYQSGMAPRESALAP